MTLAPAQCSAPVYTLHSAGPAERTPSAADARRPPAEPAQAMQQLLCSSSPEFGASIAAQCAAPNPQVGRGTGHVAGCKATVSCSTQAPPVGDSAPVFAAASTELRTHDHCMPIGAPRKLRPRLAFPAVPAPHSRLRAPKWQLEWLRNAIYHVYSSNGRARIQTMTRPCISSSDALNGGGAFR